MLTDAMDAGVKPGGLKSRTEIRVLICYALDKTGSPVPLDALKERLHFEGIANYYETAYAISDLEYNHNIEVVKEENGIKFYAATRGGVDISSALGGDVPFSIRERAVEICREIAERCRNERENRVSKEKSENGIYVTCSVMEKELELVTVRLLVPDDETAETVKNNFLKNPIEVLVNATAGLTGSKL